ncbi:DNA glycosylase/AP lyase [Corchorus capsularis]|uniref:DNA glycosylase/AP lyase n=1 Tax=Corchorus capsularis TaxID=210143 RepID=A0A1R3G8L0_COCAP|nr:DNA glycosylase/AP lyase [Corchorus capsularis]
MPELPEVEAARRAIEENCLGKEIKKVIIADDSKVIEGVSASDFEASLLGKTIVAAHRKGKNLWLQLDSPPFPTFQFGMAGAIYIKGVAVTEYKRSVVKDDDEWPSKYSKFFVELDDGLELSFTDKRRFARVRLLKDPTSVPPISELGPDALFEPMTVDEFTESISKKKTAIKALLLDQSFISGIGNWIADEVLYQARIHPLQISSSLSKESCATLHKCIKEVIEKAVEVGADSSQFPSSWIFHSREKKPGKAFVDGKKIDFINAGGRTSAYVPELQKLSGTQAAKAGGKPRKQASKRKGGEDKDNDEDDKSDEPTSEEEETTKGAKSKKGGNTRGRSKKPPLKRKSEESDDENDGSEDGSNEDDEDEDEDAKKKARNGRNNKSKQAKTSNTTKRAVNNQNSKKPKKKAK